MLAEIQRHIQRLASGEAAIEMPPARAAVDFTLVPPALELAPPSAVRIAIPGARRPQPVRGLPPDIEVSLQWKKQQVMRRWQRAVQVARARQQAKVAKLDAELWRQVQVALNNLRIQESLGGPGAADARKMREQIERNIAEKIEAARRRSEEELARELARLEAERDAELARLEREARDAARQRRVPVLELPTDELRELQAKTQLPWPALSLDSNGAESERQALADILKRRAEAARKVADAVDQARVRQIRGLQAAAARLRHLIRQDVEAAARSQALLHGIVLHVPPLDEPVGEDVTAQCAQWLAELWRTR